MPGLVLVKSNSELDAEAAALREAEEVQSTPLLQGLADHRQADGAVRHLRSIGAVYSDPGCNPRILGINWDVTADVELNLELQQATAMTQARNAELETARVRIEHNALHDSLTGLARGEVLFFKPKVWQKVPSI